MLLVSTFFLSKEVLGSNSVANQELGRAQKDASPEKVQQTELIGSYIVF